MNLNAASIVFRADAGLSIGNGHVMRCLTLADALAQRGKRCMFVSRSDAGHAFNEIRRRGHALIELSASVLDWREDARLTVHALGEGVPEWLVVDHYSFDASWECVLASRCKRLMVIDDLADRTHQCHLLLDSNLGRQASKYRALVPATAQVLTGPGFAPLRPEFAECRSASLQRRQTGDGLHHLMISMGGIDRDNATAAVLKALQTCVLGNTTRLTAVMGSQAPALPQVKALAATMPWPTRVVVDECRMGELMVDCDLSIGAAGSTSWERCCVGLPALVAVLAPNQSEASEQLQRAGAVLYFELDADLPAWLSTTLSNLAASPQVLANMSRAAAGVTDGRGCDRVIAAMLAITNATGSSREASHG